MKISELLKELADCLVRYGDCYVAVRNEAGDYDDAMSVTERVIARGSDGKPSQVELRISTEEPNRPASRD